MFRSTTTALTLATTIILAAASTGSAAETASSKLSNPKTTKVTSIKQKSESNRVRLAQQRADINRDGRVSTQDMYDFLEQWNARMEKGEATVQEYYDFLEAFHLATAPASSK